MIKIFEKFLDYESMMTTFRNIAKMLIENQPKTNDDINWNEYRIKVNISFNTDNNLQEIIAFVYRDEIELGSIYIYYMDSKFGNRISVCYNCETSNERVTEHYDKSGKMSNRLTIV